MDDRDLRYRLDGADRRGYPAYKSLRGRYDFGSFVLSIDHVQGDPFAAPSQLSVEVPARVAGLPEELYAEPHTRVALEDFLVRRFGRELSRYSFKVGGSGKSGILCASRPGPEVLRRSACEVGERGQVTLRFEAGFPAHGRTCDASALKRMLFDFVPRCVDFAACSLIRMAADEVWAAHDLAEDQHALRLALEEQGLVAFVADGSVLPRESGVSSRPLPDARAFASPDSLRVAIDLPHAGRITGMGIHRGVTLVVGGGYHGKSTLLQALQAGVYNHVAGDGREYVACDASAVKLRAEDGRAVSGVDISLFVSDLPSGRATQSFSTVDASGSTSQAAGTIEALEAGTRLLLIDEDTSATNFMVRDDLMAAVVSADHEPITPFVERARDLYERCGVSSIIVAGSSGAFFSVADCVIQMDCYQAFDITQRVREVCAERGVGEARRGPAFAVPSGPRRLRLSGSSDLSPRANGRSCERNASDEPDADASSGASRSRKNTRRDGSLKVRASRDAVQVGAGSADLRLVEQLVDDEQTEALAQMMRYALERGMFSGSRPLAEAVASIYAAFEAQGWSVLSEHGKAACGQALPRPQELFACINRWRA